MKIRSILILMIVAFVFLMVSAYAYTPAGGTFYYGGGVSTNQTNSAFSGGADNGIYGIFFRSAAALPSLGAVKFYSVKGGEGWGPQSHPVNTTDNSSSLSASLRYSGTVVSTGTLYYSLSDITGDIYIAYFVNTWSPAGIPDNSVLYLEYDRTKFNWRFSNMGKADGSEWQGNLISAGFTMSAPAVDPASIYMPYTSLGIYGHYVDYTDTWKLQYITVQKTDVSSYLDLIRNVDGVLYNSRVMVNETYNGANVTIYDEWNTIDTRISSINHDRDIYIIAWDPKLRMYAATFNLSGGYIPPPGPGTWDLNVFTYDGSSGALYNGATVTKTDLTDPAYNGWGISGVDYPGRTDFQAIQGHEYNLSATAVGMSTGYANYTASTSPSIVKLYLYPDLGYSTLEFKVVDTGDRPITGLPVRLSDGRGKLTIAGFTRFNSTSGVSYGWTVGDATTSQYVPQTGNVTATAGRTIIEVVMPLVSEIANLTEPTPSSPHASAQEFMDFIYEMVPGLAMVAVVFLFLAMMGFNPAGMAGKRSGRRK